MLKIIEETTEGWALSVYLKIQEFIDSNTVKSDEKPWIPSLEQPHTIFIESH